MNETIESILKRADFANKEDKLRALLNSCLSVSKDSEKSTYAIHDNVLFKINDFFIGLKKILNSEKKDKAFLLGVDILGIVLDELGYEMDKEDVFIFYHLRDLGKFRLKESKLKDELKVLWRQHKEYQLEDQDFSRSLKYLMRNNLIDYRRGNLWLKLSTVISYKN